MFRYVNKNNLKIYIVYKKSLMNVSTRVKSATNESDKIASNLFRHCRVIRFTLNFISMPIEQARLA
jgi:hypothetical protein